jgi:hypothetical protein
LEIFPNAQSYLSDRNQFRTELSPGASFFRQSAASASAVTLSLRHIRRFDIASDNKLSRKLWPQCSDMSGFWAKPPCGWPRRGYEPRVDIQHRLIVSVPQPVRSDGVAAL